VTVGCVWTGSSVAAGYWPSRVIRPRWITPFQATKRKRRRVARGSWLRDAPGCGHRRAATLVQIEAPRARLAFAPASAVHSVGAWLYLASEKDQPDAQVAAILDETDPRNLLRAAIPAAQARLYRALGRAGDRVRDRRFYERLSAHLPAKAVECRPSGVTHRARGGPPIREAPASFPKLFLDKR
jgi:hypothetical protein